VARHFDSSFSFPESSTTIVEDSAGQVCLIQTTFEVTTRQAKLHQFDEALRRQTSLYIMSNLLNPDMLAHRISFNVSRGVGDHQRSLSQVTSITSPSFLYSTCHCLSDQDAKNAVLPCPGWLRPSFPEQPERCTVEKRNSVS